MDGLLGDLIAPWAEHPAELDELRTRFAHILNRLGRIETELAEVHDDITALISKVTEEKT